MALHHCVELSLVRGSYPTLISMGVMSQTFQILICFLDLSVYLDLIDLHPVQNIPNPDYYREFCEAFNHRANFQQFVSVADKQTFCLHELPLRVSFHSIAFSKQSHNRLVIS